MIKETQKVISIVAITILIVFLVSISLAEDFTSGFDRAINITKALATVGTFIVAIILFDRFGLKKDLKSRQFDLVIEVAELVREMRAQVKSSNITYVVNFDLEQSEVFANSALFKHYDKDKAKTLVVDPSDYEEGIKPLMAFRNETLLPKPIRKTIAQFNYAGSSRLAYNDYDQSSHLFLAFKGKTEPSKRELAILIPDLKFKQFNKLSEKLVAILQEWLMAHSEEEINIFTLEKILLEKDRGV